MGDTYSAVEIRSTLRTFQEYLRDLIEVKFDQFQTKLRLFVNFCEKDDMFRVITRRLHEQVGDVREWFVESTSGGVAQPLPADVVSRIAHQYKVLLEMKQQRIDVRNLLSSLFSAHSIQDAHAKFRAEWLEPMRASFQRLFDRIERDLAGKEQVDLEALVASALEAIGAPAPAAKAAAGKVAKAKDELDFGELVKRLDKTVKGAKELAAKVRKDLETDVKILKLELSKHSPNLDIVRRIAEPLERRGGQLAELAAALALKAKRGQGPE